MFRSLSRHISGRYNWYLARSAVARRELGSAITLLEKAEAPQQYRSIAEIFKGNCYNQMDRLELARRHYQQASIYQNNFDHKWELDDNQYIIHYIELYLATIEYRARTVPQSYVANKYNQMMASRPSEHLLRYYLPKIYVNFQAT